MSLKKIIILVIALLLIVIALAAVLLWRSGEQPSPISGTGPAATGTTAAPGAQPGINPVTGSGQPAPGGVTQPINEFSNDYFNNTAKPAVPTGADNEEATLKLLAQNFLADFGGYSTSSGYAHIERWYSQMTPQFKAQTAAWIKTGPAAKESPTFYSIETSVSKVTITKQSPDQVIMTVDANRNATDAPEYYNKSFRQSAEIKLVKKNGAWNINRVDWQ